MKGLTKGKNIFFLIFFAALFSIALFNGIYYSREVNLLKKRGILTYGYIVDFGVKGRVGHSPEYKFHVKGEKYIDFFSFDKFCQRISLANKIEIQKYSYPVIYDPEDPKVSRILLKNKDFVKFQIPYPDSLKTILGKYFECN